MHMAGDFPIIQFKFDFRLKCLALSFIAIALNDGEEVAENMKKPLPMLELVNLVLKPRARRSISLSASKS